MTKNVRNSDRPTITWFGGAACVPIAWRNRDSTITMRVRPVIISRMAGRNDSAVKKSSVCTGTEKLVPPLLPVTSTGSAGAWPWACASAAETGRTASARATSTRRARRSLIARLRRRAAAPAREQLVDGRGMGRGAGRLHRVGRGIGGERGDALARHAEHQPVPLGADGELDDGHALRGAERQ